MAEPELLATPNASGQCWQGHGGAADQDVDDDTPALQSLAQGGESLLHLGPAEKDITRFGNAASKSRADR
jgi:hypothetical protein